MEKQEELWRPVVGYEGLYEVSNWGRVKSIPRPRTKGGVLKLSPNDKGYIQVWLYKNGEKEQCQVHQLVMRAFIGKCPDGCEVDHYDWNPKNNRLNNLSYQPKGLNRARHSPEGQRKNAEATRKANSKPVNQYTLDGEYVKTWQSAIEAVMELGLSRGNISDCCNGKRKTTGGFIWKFAV